MKSFAQIVLSFIGVFFLFVLGYTVVYNRIEDLKIIGDFLFITGLSCLFGAGLLEVLGEIKDKIK